MKKHQLRKEDLPDTDEDSLVPCHQEKLLWLFRIKNKEKRWKKKKMLKQNVIVWRLTMENRCKSEKDTVRLETEY